MPEFKPYKKGNEPGQWNHIAGNGKTIVVFCCPDCGTPELFDDYSVDGNGFVTPTFFCPNDDCNFYELLFLEEWENA